MSTKHRSDSVGINLLEEPLALNQFMLPGPKDLSQESTRPFLKMLYETCGWLMADIAKRHHKVELEYVVRKLVLNGTLELEDAYGYFYKESNPTLDGLMEFLGKKGRKLQGQPVTPSDRGRRRGGKTHSGDKRPDLATMEAATKKIQ